jgi:hypothetical protein
MPNEIWSFPLEVELKSPEERRTKGAGKPVDPKAKAPVKPKASSAKRSSK